MSALANFLREEMHRRNWSQTDLESITGIPDSTLSRILNGQTKEPKASVLLILSRAFSVPFNRLMELAGFQIKDPDPEYQSERFGGMIQSFPWLIEVVEDITSLSPEEREAVLVYLEVIRSRRPKK